MTHATKGLTLCWECPRCGRSGESYTSGNSRSGETIEAVASEVKSNLRSSHAAISPDCEYSDTVIRARSSRRTTN